ncbi:MAG: SDR family oxidoreductase [Acidimicrobiia bacterium]|nr:SDR family oxidoreductase [Acidimicrobiia bacterium]
MTDDADPSARRVLVTGGTRGLGRAIAVRFLRAGADVVVCGRTEPERPIGADGRDATFVAADLRDPDEVWRLVAAANESLGGIDVLVNNAGGAPPAVTAEASPRFTEKIIALNLLAPLWCAQAVYPLMTEQIGGGVILNIASVSGTRANPLGAAYGAAKAGLLNLTQTLAVEWGPQVRVVALTVGYVVTDGAELHYGDDAGLAAVGERLAMKRMGTPDEVADLCAFLASPAAGWITGTSIDIHGGGEVPGYLEASTADVNRNPS